MTRVPFLDLEISHSEISHGLLEDIEELVRSSAFINGPAVAEFEAAFAAFCGVDFCVGLASGLDALRLGLVAAGVEPGAEVLVPAQTFVATYEAVSQAGAVPVPVEVREDDYCIDPSSALEAVTERTQAIVPVHLFGQMADMVSLRDIASTKRIVLLEDACQAHGAVRDGVRAGVAGDVSAFSFYPSKNLGAWGDAGALVTSDEEMATRVRALREHGQRRKNEPAEIGWTARLDTLQALVLSRKLPHLGRWNDERSAAARYYATRLEGLGDLRLPSELPATRHVWHVYVVRTDDASGLGGFLEERGIGFGRHYPTPPHLTDAYRALGYRPGSFPVAEALAREGISLPLFPGITEAQLEHVADAVEAWFRK